MTKLKERKQDSGVSAPIKVAFLNDGFDLLSDQLNEFIQQSSIAVDAKNDIMLRFCFKGNTLYAWDDEYPEHGPIACVPFDNGGSEDVQ